MIWGLLLLEFRGTFFCFGLSRSRPLFVLRRGLCGQFLSRAQRSRGKDFEVLVRSPCISIHVDPCLAVLRGIGGNGVVVGLSICAGGVDESGLSRWCDCGVREGGFDNIFFLCIFGEASRHVRPDLSSGMIMEWSQFGCIARFR